MLDIDFAKRNDRQRLREVCSHYTLESFLFCLIVFETNSFSTAKSNVIQFSLP